MGRFATRYSDAQREAIYRLIHVDRMSAPEAAKRLAEGPVYGAEPITMPVVTARTIANKLRERRSGDRLTALAMRPIASANETLAKRALAVIDEELSTIEKQKHGKRDVLRLERLFKAQRQVTQARADTEPSLPAGATPAPLRERDSPLLARLAGAEQSDKRKRADTARPQRDDTPSRARSTAT